MVVLAVVAGLGFLAYRVWFAGGGGGELELVTEPVKRTTIRATIVASGAVEAVDQVTLRFTGSGRVQETLVETGQQVKQGDPLVRLEDDALRNRQATAQANLTSAQIGLNIVLKGASDAELAAAEQSLVSAQAALDGAQRDLDELREGPSAADLAAGEQAVAAAEASLASAQATHDQLIAGPSAAELAAAESTVASAEQALTNAKIASENALANLDSTEAGLRVAGAVYCTEVVGDPLCSPFVVPLDQATVANLLPLLSDPATDPILLNQINALLQTNTAYVAASNAVDTAQASVASTEAALEAAEETLAALEEGPDDQDVEAARAAVASAEATLQSAELSLDDLREGADATQIATAEDAVRSARASVDAAMTKREEILAGAEPEDVDLQQQQVRLAQLSVEAAQHDLEEATLLAPFDGTVAGVEVQPGDLVGPSVNVLTLLTPGAMKVEISVGETELPNIRTGMGGVILFDAVQGRPFPIVVSTIDLAPSVEQGVVTYTVEAALQGLAGDEPKPAPGMNGSAVLVTEQRVDVLAVPSRAIRRLGGNLTVDVMVNGVAEPRVIKTGLTDGEMTEVTEGLEEGDLVVVGTREAGGEAEQPSGAPTAQELPEGIR